MKFFIAWIFSTGILSAASLNLNGGGVHGSSPIVANFQDATFKNTLSATVLPQSSGGSVSSATTNGRVIQTTTSATITDNIQLATSYSGTYPLQIRTPIYTSSSTGICTVNNAGYVTQVANGAATINCQTSPPLYIAPYSYTFTTTGGGSAQLFLNWAVVSPVSLPAHLNSQIDNLITTAGSFSSSKQNVFSARNFSTHSFTRNTSVWTGSVDLSAVACQTDYYGLSIFIGTLITPTDMVIAYHTAFAFIPGTGVYFTDNSNVTYRATCGSSAQISSGDLGIVHLIWSGATPSSLAIMPVLPSIYATYWPDHNANYFPVVITNQFNQIFVQDSGQISFTSSSFLGGFFSHNAATETNRSPWTLNVVSNDSSNPVMTIINGQAVLIGGNTFSSLCVNCGDNISAMNTALATLDAGGTVYTVTTPNLTSPIAFPTY